MTNPIGDRARPDEPATSRRSFPVPRSVSGQIAVLVVMTIVVTHILIAIALFFAGAGPWRIVDTPGGVTNRLAVVARMLETAQADQRQVVFALARAAEPSMDLSLDEAAPADAGSEAHPQAPRLLQNLGAGYQVLPLTKSTDLSEDGVARLTVETPSRLIISARVPFRLIAPPYRWGPVLGTIVFLAAMLSVLSVWATRALAAPLARLAEAAEAFGRVDDSTPLPDRGPEEVLTVSRALGRMRDRVTRLIDDRTRMLAAISHDLRTPITRMRLRAEFIDDDDARAATLRDLDQMNALVEAALSFVRDGRKQDQMAPLDLAALVQTVCDDFADMGADVEAETLRHVLINGRSDELQRAISNLVDNAVKYGRRVRVSMAATSAGATVAIADEGPGIPAADHVAMLQPFVRGDRARNLDETPGFGLGLSIATAIVEAHSGQISLANREPHGLVVTLSLPRAAGISSPREVATAPADDDVRQSALGRA